MDTAIAQNNAQYYMEPGFDTTGPWLATKMLYESLYMDTAVLDSNGLMNTFYNAMDTTDRGLILQSELENQLLTDSAILADTASMGDIPSGYNNVLTDVEYLNYTIPTANVQAANYVAMSNIYFNTIAQGIDTFTNGQLDTIAALAIQCPYASGDAVYIARSLYAQYDNTIFFDDLAICTPISGGERMLWLPNTPQDTTADTVKPSEYIFVYPNPARNILKVFYSSAGSNSMTFELTDLMGQTLVSKPVTPMSVIDVDISHLASSLYLWRGRDGNVTIQIGKVSIQK